MVFRFALFLLFLIIPALSCAQINTMPSRWSGGVISLTQASPYIGGEDGPSVFPFVAYRGEKLIWQGPRLEYFVKGRPNADTLAVSVNLTLAPNELDTDNDPRLAGIENRSNSMMAGVTMNHPLAGGIVSVSAQTMALGQHDGQRATAEWQRPVFTGQQGKWQVFGGVQVEWLSSDYSNYYFGVTDVEANRSRFAAYTLDSQFQFGLSLGGFYRLSNQWMLLSNITTTSLSDDIKDSPIVEGSNVLNGFVGVSYQF